MLKRMNYHECGAVTYVYQYLVVTEEIVWTIQINESIEI